MAPTNADYADAGVPARQLGWTFREWLVKDIVTILHHFDVRPNLRRRSTGSKLELLRHLDEVTQRHHLTIGDKDLVLQAHRIRRSLEPNGTTPLEGSRRVAWQRRLTEICSADNKGKKKRNANTPRVASNSNGNGGLPAVVSLPLATNPIVNRPRLGLPGHSHSSSSSVRRFIPYPRSGLIPRPPTIIQPTTRIAAVSGAVLSGPVLSTSAISRTTSEDLIARGPAGGELRERHLEPSTTIQPPTSISAASRPGASTLATSGPTSENSTVQPNVRECGVCLTTPGLERFPKRNITSTCNHTPNVCLSCLEQSIATQFSTKVWDQIDCPTCSQRLEHSDVKKFASSVVFGKYV